MQKKFTLPGAFTLCLLVCLFLSTTSSAQIDSLSVYLGGGAGGSTNSQVLSYPIGMAIDTTGNVYIADSGGLVHKFILNSNTMVTIAGGGSFTPANGLPALEAKFNAPGFLALDLKSGNLYMTESNGQRILRISPAGILTIIAGTGTAGFSGDGGPATAAQLNGPKGIVRDAAGNLFFADEGNNRVRKIDTAGIITTIAGTGVAGYNGDSIPAITAELNAPYSITIGTNGTLFVGEVAGQRIRWIDPSGMITTIVGTGVAGFTGDTDSLGPAAEINTPAGLYDDTPSNTLFIADAGNGLVRVVNDNNLSYIYGYQDEPGGIYFFPYYQPRSLIYSYNQALNFDAIDAPGSVLVVLSRFMAVSYEEDRYVSTFAGNGDSVYAPNTGAGNNAIVSGPASVLAGKNGTVYYTDSNTVEVIQPGTGGASGAGGNLQVFAGTGVAGSGGDGGPAASAQLNNPFGLAQDPLGRVYVGTRGDNKIRMIDTAGVIHTFAGTGAAGYSGDGGAATSAAIRGINGLASDGKGNVFFSDTVDAVVRKIDITGKITTLAGTGAAGYSGDGGQASSAQLGNPGGISVDAMGNIYVADSYVNSVRKIDTNGVITTIAGGTTARGSSGDYGPATAATFGKIIGVSSDARGNVYVLDGSNDNIRRVVAGTGIIAPVAGGGGSGGSGYFPIAFQSPAGLTQDSAGNLYIGDMGYHQVLKAFVHYRYADSTETVRQFVAPPFSADPSTFAPVYITDDSFRRLAVITPLSQTNAVSGNVTVTVTVDTAVLQYLGNAFVPRHYDITPAVNPAGSQAILSLFFSSADFNAYNNAEGNGGAGVLQPGGNLFVVQYHGTGTAPGNYSGQGVFITPTSVDTVYGADTVTGYMLTFPVTGFSGFYVTGAVFPLPLTLLSFTGQLQGTDALLHWTATDEVNTQSFMVQRSDGNAAFVTVGTVAALSTPGTNGYNYTDAGLTPGTWLYRLQLVDKDGTITYSPIVSLTLGASGAGMLLYPNPVDDLLSVQLTAGAAGMRTVQLTDMQGHVLQEQVLTLNPGASTITFKTAGLSAGAYLIVSTGADGSKLVQGFIKK